MVGTDLVMPPRRQNRYGSFLSPPGSRSPLVRITCANHGFNANKSCATAFAARAMLRGNERPERASGRIWPVLPMSTLACLLLLGAAMAGLYHLLPRPRP